MNHETQRASILQMAQGAFQERVQHRFASPLMATGKWSLPKWCRSSPARCAWTGMNRKHRKF